MSDKSLQDMTNAKIEKSLDRAKIAELQAIAAFKDALPNAINYSIIPIDEMSKDPHYDGRFTEKHLYHPLLILGELKTLDKRKGGDLWLTGERLVYVRDKKLFKKEYGHSTFEEWYTEVLDMSKATAYRSIYVYENFEYEQACSLGAKLYLLYNVKNTFPENEKRKAYDMIADPRVTYREAEEAINKIKDEMVETTIDAFFSVTEKSETTDPDELENRKGEIAKTFSDILDGNRDEDYKPVIKSSDNKPEPAEPTLKKETPTGAIYETLQIDSQRPKIYIKLKTEDGNIKLEKTEKDYLKHDNYPVIIPWSNEILQKAFHHVIQEKEGTVLRWIKDYLALPENHREYDRLKKLIEQQQRKTAK